TRAQSPMTSVATFFFDNLWSGLMVWVVLYVSDYSLTLACARLYRQGVCDKIVFEGSFELTPYFQADIDSLRAVSPRFLAALIIGLVYLVAVRGLLLNRSPASTSLFSEQRFQVNWLSMSVTFAISSSAARGSTQSGFFVPALSERRPLRRSLWCRLVGHDENPGFQRPGRHQFEFSSFIA